MEPLVKHISNNNALQDQIDIFLHYGYSLEHFLETSVRHELNNEGVDAIFRQNRKLTIWW
jgi:hypothetical protein